MSDIPRPVEASASRSHCESVLKERLRSGMPAEGSLIPQECRAGAHDSAQLAHTLAMLPTISAPPGIRPPTPELFRLGLRGALYAAAQLRVGDIGLVADDTPIVSVVAWGPTTSEPASTISIDDE